MPAQPPLPISSGSALKLLQTKQILRPPGACCSMEKIRPTSGNGLLYCFAVKYAAAVGRQRIPAIRRDRETPATGAINPTLR